MSPLPCRVNTLFTLQKTVVHVPIVQISNTCVPPHIYSGTHNNNYYPIHWHTHTYIFMLEINLDNRRIHYTIISKCIFLQCFL